MLRLARPAAIAACLIATATHAQLPLSSPLPATAGLEDRGAALTCLATAIAYEAAFEPVVGQQAVAEVILNRVRHPAFPKTICGVVYAGSQRRTGCQFSFTCDGSLKRVLRAGVMTAVRAVAAAALDGQTASHVGGATHYHADYVSPYWAPSLVRTVKIGAHIFYRMPGERDQPVSALRFAGGQGAAAPALIDGGGSTTPALAPPKPTVFAPWGLAPAVDPPGQ